MDRSDLRQSGTAAEMGIMIRVYMFKWKSTGYNIAEQITADTNI